MISTLKKGGVAFLKKSQKIEGQLSLHDFCSDFSPSKPEEREKGKEKKEREKKNNKPKLNSADYWSSIVDLINAWSAYISKEKIWWNLNDPNTRGSVWHVIEKYYDGRVWKLERQKEDLYAKLISELKRHREMCKKILC